MKTCLSNKSYSRLHLSFEPVNLDVTLNSIALYNKVYRFTPLLLYRLNNNNNFCFSGVTFFTGLAKRYPTHTKKNIIFYPIWTFAVNPVNL